MKLYNTMTKTKEEFVPAEAGKVTIYVCGPTVYDYFHIGNARPFIIFDTLRRYFEYIGYNVTFVQNFTDVDDKMIARAEREKVTLCSLGERFIEEYYKDARALGIKPATVHPRATRHMAEIISLIETIIKNGHAYQSGGDVYFDVRSFPGYGNLSGQSMDELLAGARADVFEQKKNPGDFALWKAAKPGEYSWDSPWGKGRPGWHIECSAMSMKYLGETIDIHAGGQDLIFPHHENEAAQSEAATGKPFAKYWMHNGYINVDNEKMSKSKGNFFTVRDISQKYDLKVVRLFMLSAHYRSPINFSEELIAQAASAMARIKNFRHNLKHISASGNVSDTKAEGLIGLLTERFKQAMDDDLNTAEALGAIFEFIRDINIEFENGADAKDAVKALKAFDKLLDVLGFAPEDDSVPEEILELARKRKEARAERDFAQADAYRDSISALGYTIKDTPDGEIISRR
ncbi:MAG: cysteine--tRNA ligase [Christensenellales bacterium]